MQTIIYTGRDVEQLETVSIHEQRFHIFSAFRVRKHQKMLILYTLLSLFKDDYDMFE